MKFGTLPRSRFTPPPNTRGGGFDFNKEPERPLTGSVQNLKAAQGEERFSRTLNKSINKGLIQKYYFRWTTLKRGVVGYKELDYFVLAHSQAYAISIKGEDFVHRSSSSKNQDAINELIILAQLRQLGYNIPKVITVAAADLNTQEDADKVGKRLGLYR